MQWLADSRIIPAIIIRLDSLYFSIRFKCNRDKYSLIIKTNLKVTTNHKLCSGADALTGDVGKRLLVTAVVLGAILLVVLLLVAIGICLYRRKRWALSTRQTFVIPQDTPALTTHRVHLTIPPRATDEFENGSKLRSDPFDDSNSNHGQIWKMIQNYDFFL